MAIGAAGLAALLSGGAYMITEAQSGSGAGTVEAGAVGAADASAAAVLPGSSAPAGRSSSASTAQPSSAAKSISPEVQKSIDAAREDMRKHGVPIKRPVIPTVPQTNDDIEMTTQGSLKAGGIVRVLALHGDLTGQRELAYVAGGIAKYDGVPCSQTFQFSTNPAPSKRPNLLMCWRVTPKKSVAAIVVDPKGHPSRAKAVQTIEQKWRSMG